MGEEVERRVEKFIKAVTGILALMFAGAYCLAFLRGNVDEAAFGTIVASVAAFFFAQKGTTEAQKQTATSLAKSNGHAPAALPPPSPTLGP